MLHAIITVGMPATGKTCYVSRFVDYTTINSDAPKEDIFPVDFHESLRKSFGKNLIIDGCNHTAMQRFAIIKILQQEGYKVAGLCFDVPCDRNRLRENKELRSKAVQVKRDMCRPSMTEGFDTLEFIRTPDLLPQKPKKKAVFFNVDLAVTAGAAALENLLNEYSNDGFSIIALGNQDECSHVDYQEYLLRIVRALKCDITDVFYCHHRGFCNCRFPKPELALNAARRHALDLPNCIMLCVDDVDMEFGKRLRMIYYKPPNASWSDKGQISKEPDSISNPT